MHQKFINLSLAASGSTNLGMLALLLKRGAILPGSVLFIDEPEVHLHPAWQVILVKTLYELSKRGVTVIIASHSIDIMKAIEMLMDSDDEIDQSQHFGINQLTADGMSVDISENNFKRLAAIKEDLGKPFYDMFIEEGL
jgi:predicted ATPase